MSENIAIDPGAIETAQFESGPGEVLPPPCYTNTHFSLGETYTFSLPPSQVPASVMAIVARRQTSTGGCDHSDPGLV